MFTRIPFAMIQFQCRTGLHEPRSAIDLGKNNYSNDKSPPPRQVILEFVPN